MSIYKATQLITLQTDILGTGRLTFTVYIRLKSRLLYVTVIIKEITLVIEV